ncbi:phytanoyl-CoA dioxygenase family protein [Pseudomarimonas salicorniae]|uniref:Phytanoyl-CoA dioxygenase family protein n=1 Tax=Pseudomarimonas salicorniae TaxID=2933270 RepID=A0ABT0GEX4_9GAMM|nr:phytanoyl-CoA dioxygenase family protein [Lysobacter sp. CAU 1642]
MSQVNWNGDGSSCQPGASQSPEVTSSPAAQPHSPYSPPFSASEVERFRSDGYLVARGSCAPAELQEIRAVLEQLFSQSAGRDEGNQLDMLSLDIDQRSPVQPQLVKPSLYAPSLLRTKHFHRIQAMAQQLLGGDAKFCFDHCILKPANSVAATPWHQDEAHNQDPHYRHDQISFWIALQDVSEDNGCMRYLPGSNHGPVLPHCSPNDDPRIHALECPTTHFDEHAAVTAPLRAGVCVLHDGLTLHSALPNRSSMDRLAYILVFRGPPLKREKPVKVVWLESKRTSSLQRQRRWRYRGGFAVLLLRRARRMLSTLRQVLFRLIGV